MVQAMIALFLLLFAQAGPETTPLDWKALLASAASDPKLHSLEQRLKLMKDPVSPGLWKKAELKGKAEGFDKQEFGGELSIKPFGWGERDGIKSQWQGRSRLLEAARKNILNQVIESRWAKGLQWIFSRRKLEYHTAMKAIYTERVKTHLGLVGTSSFNAQDLVLSQQMVNKLEGDLLADQNDLDEVETSIRRLVPGNRPIALDTSAFLSPVEFSRTLESLPKQVDSTFPQMAVSLEKVRSKEADLTIENASYQNWISDISMGYSRQTQEKVKTKYILTETDVTWFASITVPLPFGDTRSMDKQRRRMDLLDEAGDMEQERDDLERKFSELRMAIGSGLRQIAVCDSFVRKVDAGALFTEFVVSSGEDPLLLLKGRAALLEAQWDMQKLKHEVLRNGIELLALTGRLAEPAGGALRVNGTSGR
jgi:hypothetical protein